MKTNNDVFFFTLIDFLVQVFFFGLLLFVVSKAIDANKEEVRGMEAKRIEKLKKAAGVSSLTELLDHLTRLAPLKELQGTAEFIQQYGGVDTVKQALKAVSDAGGIEELKAKVQKYDEQYGLPSCVGNDTINGKSTPRAVATLRVEDDSITIVRSTPDFERLLLKLDATAEQVQQLNLAAFRSRFQPVRSIFKTCAYFVDVQANTQYLNPMRAVWSGFRTK